MPFVLIIAGIVLLVAAARDTQCQLFTLMVGDFTGANNFIYWFLAIMVIGAVGYVPKLKPVSDAFLILVILQLFLFKDRGFFDQFMKQIGSVQSGGTINTGNNSTAGGVVGGTVVIAGVPYTITQPVQH